MNSQLKKRFVMAAVIATTACSVSYSLSAADTVEPKSGGTVIRAVGGAGKFVEDVAITTTVKTKLVADSETKSRDIKVITDKGVVTLIGEVDSASQIREAEAIARSVEGVQDVKNELKLKTP